MKARPRSLLLLGAGGLVLVEAAATAVTAAYLLLQLGATPSNSIVTTIALAVLAALFAAGLAAAAVALLRGRAWSRAAILVWQLLQIAVGISALTGSGGQPWVGWPLIVVAVLVAALLFTPPVLAATTERGARP